MISPEESLPSQEQDPIQYYYYFSKSTVLGFLSAPERSARMLIEGGDFLYNNGSLTIQNDKFGFPIWAHFDGYTYLRNNDERGRKTVVDVDFPGPIVSGFTRLRGDDPQCKVAVGHYPINYGPMETFLAEHAKQ